MHAWPDACDRFIFAGIYAISKVTGEIELHDFVASILTVPPDEHCVRIALLAPYAQRLGPVLLFFFCLLLLLSTAAQQFLR